MVSERALINRLLSQIASDFDRLRWERQPIRTQLIHLASNAEAEGVRGQPAFQGELVGIQSAGHREGGIRRDEQGNPCLRDDPILDAVGKPIINSDGKPVDVIMPASRNVAFLGEPEDFTLFSETAQRAGRILAKLDGTTVPDLLGGWMFSTSADLWWAFVFELAWSHRHPLLTAEKRLWLPANEPNKFIPYDLQTAQRLNSTGSVGLNSLFQIPANWLIRLPDAFVSVIENMVTASLDAIDFLLSESYEPSTPSNEVPNSYSNDKTGFNAAQMSPQIKRRFAVALSFPGEHRKFVEEVALELKAAFGENRIFYDKFHEVELARPNSDLVLHRFYGDESDLVVVFVCGEYSEREWCGLEWRVIRDLMKNKSRLDDDVMFFRFDDKPLEGLLSIDGFIDISQRNPSEVFTSIIRRWTATR
jgi:hypothetical protein